MKIRKILNEAPVGYDYSQVVLRDNNDEAMRKLATGLVHMQESLFKAEKLESVQTVLNIANGAYPQKELKNIFFEDTLSYRYNDIRNLLPLRAKYMPNTGHILHCFEDDEDIIILCVLKQELDQGRKWHLDLMIDIGKCSLFDLSSLSSDVDSVVEFLKSTTELAKRNTNYITRLANIAEYSAKDIEFRTDAMCHELINIFDWHLEKAGAVLPGANKKATKKKIIGVA